MFEIRGRDFYLDGKKCSIYSGAMHYFRIPREYWADRLLKLKAAGFNTVETYVAWNVHQPEEDTFDFEGQNSLVEFIQTAQEIGLYVIVRPGPYICAEWDFGGFPAWLLKYDDIQLRCCNERYLGFVKQYFEVLLPKLVPLQVTHGGPILMMQVENEYGSYGRDKKYLAFLRGLMRKNGIDVTLFTSDGEGKYHLSGGGIDGEFKVVNFGGFPKDCFHDLRQYQPDKPLMCGEMWCGWFDHFREKHHHSPAAWSKKTYTKILNQFFEENASFNFYMFHGGTNFGFMAGANFGSFYQPTTTSYDYDAPLNEYGDYTAKYFIMRELLCRHRGIEPPALPPRPQTQMIGEVPLIESAGLVANIEHIAERFTSHQPYYMEHYGQSYGMIRYHTVVEGDYPETTISADDVHDLAAVYINGTLVGRYDRSEPLTKKQRKRGVSPTEGFTFPIPAFRGKMEVDIFVEALGRVNFARRIYDRKGLGAVRIGEQYVYGFDIDTIPLDRLDRLRYDGGRECPVYLKGTFRAAQKADCFVDMGNFTRGYVFLNGVNLGRYWNVGPQRALYLPGVWLREENEIVVLELERLKRAAVEITDHLQFR